MQEMQQQPTPTPEPLTLRQRLQLVPPARIIAAVEDSGDVLTLGDLRQFAKYLANEFRHHAASAAEQPASWYGTNIEHCTPAQAETVRAMTIELCSEVTLYTGYNQAILAGGVRRAEMFDAVGFATLMFALLLLVPLLLRATDQPAATPTAGQVLDAAGGR